MLIRDQLRGQGERLFRRRNTLPALLLPLALWALWDSRRLSFLLGPALDETFEWACLSVSVAGVGLRFAVAGYAPRHTSSRRSTLAAGALNTTGLYSVVRHPLYLANLLIFAGLILATGSLWFVLTASLTFWLYYERIAFAEEEFLQQRFGEAYLAWARATPALIPRLRLWRRPALPFCWKSAARREYRTLCATLLVFALLDVGEDTLAHGRLDLEPDITLLLSCALLLFSVMRFLHKRTRWLHVPGR